MALVERYLATHGSMPGIKKVFRVELPGLSYT